MSLDSKIIAERARAENAARIAQAGFEVNHRYVSLVDNVNPPDYVTGTGMPYGSRPLSIGGIQRVFWDEDNPGAGWQNYGEVVSTTAFVDTKINQEVIDRDGAIGSAINQEVIDRNLKITQEVQSEAIARSQEISDEKIYLEGKIDTNTSNITAAALGVKPFQTKALMDGFTPGDGGDNRELARVDNDSTPANNGDYAWDGSAWVKSLGYGITGTVDGDNILSMKKDGVDSFPLTIPEAVIDSVSGRNIIMDIAKKIGSYNITELKPLPDGQYYTLETVKTDTPVEYMKPGMLVTFKTGQIGDDFIWETHQFTGDNINQWGSSRWKQIINVTQLHDSLNNIKRSSGTYYIIDSPQVLKEFSSKTDARNYVPAVYRKPYLTIVYSLEGVIISERFVSTYIGNWTNNENIWLNDIDTQANIDTELKKGGSYLLINSIGLLENYSTREEAYLAVPIKKRVQKLVLSYRLSGEYITEQYIGTQLTESPFTNPKLWVSVYTNSLYKNSGVLFPSVGVSVNYTNLTTGTASPASAYMRALLDCEIHGSNFDSEYIFTIDLLCKNRVANDYGNGIILRKRLRDDYSSVESIVYKSLSASEDIKFELNKFELNRPEWVIIPAFGMQFKLLIDGSMLSNGGSGEVSTSPSGYLYGHYLSESCYRAHNVNDTGLRLYDTVNSAAQVGETQPFLAGQLMVKPVVDNPSVVGSVDTYNAKQVSDQFNLIGSPTRNHGLSYNADLIRISTDDGNADVCFFGKEYTYFIASGVLYRSKSPFNEPFNKTTATFEKFVLPYPLTNQQINGNISCAIETNDGDIIIEVENGELYSGSLRYRNVYRINDLSSLVTNELDSVEIITVGSGDISHLFYLNKGIDTRLLPHWGVSMHDNIILFAPYGGGRSGTVRYSDDFGRTFVTIYSMGVDVFVDTKPNGSGGFGANGAHPLPSDLVPPMPETMWDVTGNGNVHTHGVVFDAYWNRIWVVTGDAGGSIESYSAIWYTDDLGYTWSRVETAGSNLPFYQYGTQFVSIIPMANCVLFGCDGKGSGYYRYNRNSKNSAPIIEPSYHNTGANTGIENIAGGHFYASNGDVYGSFFPNAKGDIGTYPGGIVVTNNGYNYTKFYIDEFADGALETNEISWGTKLTEIEKYILCTAKNGGVIKIRK